MTEPDSPIAPQRAKQADLLPELSVVVPVHNEAGNIENLIAEIESALTGCCEFEIVYVDDGSDDGSAAELAGLRSGHARLRVLRHRNRSGQSAALWTGIAGARAAWIATMDGDGQNDPADIPALLDAYLALPFFDHMHRFLPALIRRAGGAVLEVPVNHRPRAAGASHYGMWDRAWVGLIDMLGVAWLQRRMKSPIVEDPIVEDPIVEEMDES